MKFVVVKSIPAGASPKWLTARAGKIWRAIVKKHKSAKWKSVTLVFVPGREMKRLNKQFRGKDYATDVLSFAPSEEGSLGELVFCPDVLVKQAREHGLSYQLELTYMLIHGLLHLLGHDHEGSSSAAKKMFEIQDDVFAQFLKKSSR